MATGASLAKQVIAKDQNMSAEEKQQALKQLEKRHADSRANIAADAARDILLSTQHVTTAVETLPRFTSSSLSSFGRKPAKPSMHSNAGAAKGTVEHAYCTHCGHANSVGFTFCVECGEKSRPLTIQNKHLNPANMSPDVYKLLHGGRERKDIASTAEAIKQEDIASTAALRKLDEVWQGRFSGHAPRAPPLQSTDTDTDLANTTAGASYDSACTIEQDIKTRRITPTLVSKSSASDQSARGTPFGSGTSAPELGLKPQWKPPSPSNELPVHLDPANELHGTSARHKELLHPRFDADGGRFRFWVPTPKVPTPVTDEDTREASG